MSGRFKLKSAEEVLEKKKRKRQSKVAVVEAASAPVQVEGSEPTPQAEDVVARPSKKLKGFPRDEDLENVVVRIPRTAGVISDPSSITPFVKNLMLEEDEMRLKELGSVGISNRVVALAYQIMECGLFQAEDTETSQRRLRDLEKANTQLRKDNAALKDDNVLLKKRAEGAEQDVKSLQATLAIERETTKAEIDAYKESIESFKQEKEELIEQIDEVSCEARLAERSDLMKQYLSGDYKSWEPQKWIDKYARIEVGIWESEDEDVERKVAGESSQAAEGNAEKVVDEDGSVADPEISKDVSTSAVEDH